MLEPLLVGWPVLRDVACSVAHGFAISDMVELVGAGLASAAVKRVVARMWTLAFGHHEDRTPSHGYAERRETAMAAFAMSWRRE
jgi:hypothetical protein